MWDSIIVGAGAAGLMTAVTAGRLEQKVLLLDGKEKIGAKILMSGGTRANLTNKQVSERDFETENKRAVRNILRAFPSGRALEFFHDLGVETVLEPGGKYFPATHSAKTVLDALTHEIRRVGIELHTPRKATRIRKDGDVFTVSGDHFSYSSRTVVLATGGLSHPATGSDGTGYGLALSFGHHKVRTTPALTPLLTKDRDWQSLAGISVPVRLALWVDKKKQITFEGPMLFTHFGLSGPAALNISRHWIHFKNEGREVELTACFLGSPKEADFREAARRFPSRTVKNFLAAFFAERFSGIILKKSGVSESVILNQLARHEREALVRLLLEFPLEASGVYGYQKAEVTAGGIGLDEVNTQTMESKLVPGLFFAGEILDADGRIGGFNFQWAWATGYLAGCGVCRRKI